MKRRSLSVRLLVASGLATAAALVITAVVFSQLFEGYFRQRLESELETHLQQLTANLGINEDGELAVAEMPDVRFSQPLSGLYWQVQREEGLPLVSRSLWDEPFDVTVPQTPGEPVAEVIPGTDGEPLLAVTWSILVGGDGAALGDSEELVMSVAADLSEIETFASGFRQSVGMWLGLLGVALIAAAWVQVGLGLRPMDTIRSEVRKVRDHPGLRIQGDFPAEVSPLVEEVNELLDGQQRLIEQARHRSGDLAHGLKTPLTVMRGFTRDLREAGRDDLAAQIEEQIAAMTHFVERELARSRSGSGTRRTWSDLGAVGGRMVRAVAKMPSTEGLTWRCEVEDGIEAPLDEHDLSEMLGNLLDNARKHARTEVTLRASQTEGKVIMRVSDDGPGVKGADIATILKRGARLGDDGYGLGLAICQDLAEAHGCALSLHDAPEGGLEARLTWAVRRT